MATFLIHEKCIVKFNSSAISSCHKEVHSETELHNEQCGPVGKDTRLG